MSGMAEALEAEWYNGNLDERAYNRLLVVLRASEVPTLSLDDHIESAFARALRVATSVYDVTKFMEPEGYTGCPCFEIDVEDFRAEGHCWRQGHEHPYASRLNDGRCCLHYTGDPTMGERLRTLLDGGDWYGGWALVPDEVGSRVGSRQA